MLAFARRLLLIAGATLAVTAAVACALNPQPLPPGDQGGDAAGGTAADGSFQNGSDSATLGSPGDAAPGTRLDASADGSPPGDGQAASVDGATEAGDDGSRDAGGDEGHHPPRDGAVDSRAHDAAEEG